MFVSAIIAAAGAGRRVGADRPKQLIDIGGGSMLYHSVQAFLRHPRVAEVIVVKPPGPLALYLIDEAEVARVEQLRVVDGGERRQDSVANGFDAVDPKSDVILVHDAARPFVSADLISRTIDAAAEHGAAIAAVQSRDTVKCVDGGIITGTIPRESVYLAQTPQGFRREVLAQAVALGRGGAEATDEAALAERAGTRVHIVEGDPGNVKITTADDLEAARRRLSVKSASSAAEASVKSASSAAEASVKSASSAAKASVKSASSAAKASVKSASSAAEASAKSAAAARVGTGYDLHVLVDGRPLIVAGVTLASDRGALGHSDADVACHAATDALLGAASLGDIGRHFPDTDARWKDADSILLLRETARLVRGAGFEPVNLDLTIVLERPKIKDAIDAMRARLAEAIGIDVSGVSVKGKTNEGVDAVGRGEAIAAHAVALLRGDPVRGAAPPRK